MSQSVRIGSFSAFPCIPGLVVAACLLAGDNRSLRAANFPDRPITVIVYTAPGGQLDITARKFIHVAKEFTEATFVVENRPGAGGIVAIERVLQMPADGYTLCACTKSNIAKVVSANRVNYLDDLHWAGLLIKDPECVITRRGGPIQNWEALLADARKRTRPQIWLGPATGGQDHVFAMKTWAQFGIPAQWVPFSSGNEALVALLGDQGTAYVGNPRDAVGNPELQLIAVSSSRRLDQFPDAPIYAELGAPKLDNEYMWRGFALKQGCPSTVLAWYDDLFRRITADEEWQRFWKKEGMEVVYDNETQFAKVVQQDLDDFRHYLKGMIQPHRSGSRLWMWGLPLLTLLAAVVVTWRRFHHRPLNQLGQMLIPAAILVGAMFFLGSTFRFPHVTGVGAAAVPQLWIALLTPLCLYAFLHHSAEATTTDEGPRRTDLVWGFIGLLALYWLGTIYLGYYASSAAFLLAAMFLLGVRDPRTAGFVAAGWLVFAYVTFGVLLDRTLPAGRLFERISGGG